MDSRWQGALALAAASMLHVHAIGAGGPYSQVGSFEAPGGLLDVLPDGRAIVLSGTMLMVQDSVSSSSFLEIGSIDPSLLGEFGASFARVSGDGGLLAVGDGAFGPGSMVHVFNLATDRGAMAPMVSVEAGNFEAAWDGATLYVSGGDFADSFVTRIDIAGETATATRVVEGIGGASGGVTVRDGVLYTANGFDYDTGGGSVTGEVRAFDLLTLGGAPLDFEAEGVTITTALSGGSLGFTGRGDMLIGGGDFLNPEQSGFIAIGRAGDVEAALGGGGPIPQDALLRLSPEGDQFYSTLFNPATSEVWVWSGGTVFRYAIPAPGALALVGAAGLGAIRRRRRVVVVLGAVSATAGASDFATAVLDYTPAPGQFINAQGAEGIWFNDPAKALGAPVGGGTRAANNAKVVTLGGFGGSITLAFDRTVLDDPCNPMGLDAIVHGNAVWVGEDPTRRWAEPAVIEVSRDLNGNGVADDRWWVIRGSSLDALPAVAWRTQGWDGSAGTTTPPSITAWYPSAPHFPGWPGMYETGAFELPAQFNPSVIVNPGGADATAEAHWGYGDMSPTMLLGDMTGALGDAGENLLSDPEDLPGIDPALFYTVPDDPMEVGVTPGSGGGDAFDIASAVDPETGAPAGLDGFDFIRISTGVDVVGALGEKSSEIGGIARVRSLRPIPGDADGDGAVTFADLNVVLSQFNMSGPTEDLAGDLDCSGTVGFGDLNEVLSHWGEGAAP